MAYNEARKRATSKYMNNNLDNVTFRLPKEKKDDRPTKDEIIQHAEKYGYSSTQQFIIKAISNQILIDSDPDTYLMNFSDCKKEK